TASVGASMPEPDKVASTRRRDSGSLLHASAMPPLVRIDEIRLFRPAGDTSKKPWVAAPSMAVARIVSAFPASHCAQSVPAARALRTIASNSALSLPALQLRMAIRRRTAVGEREEAAVASAPGNR